MIDFTSFDAGLKVQYSGQTLKKLGYEGRPLFGMLTKMERFGGRNHPLPVLFANGQNVGANFGAAHRINSGDPSTSSSSLAEFLLTAKKKYAAAYIDRHVMLASEGDVNAFARAAMTEIDGAISQITDDIHFDLFRSGTGARGTVDAIAAGNVIYSLVNPEDTAGFEVGMAVQACSGTDPLAILISDIVTVVAVDRSAGTVTLSAAITGLANGGTEDCVLFRYGDRQAAAITSTSQYYNLAGLNDWLPATAPTSTAFFGVDRSVDPDRLGGLRIPSESSYRKTMFSAAIECGRQGARGDKVCFVNHTDLAGIMYEFEGKLTHETVNTVGQLGIGFSSIVVQTPAGSVKVVADHQCPVGVGFLLDMSTWKLYSTRSAPHLVDEAGKYLRSHTDDSYKVELAAYLQLGCNAPGRNARITW